MPEKRIYGQLKSFPLGINSKVDPLLLPPNQLAFASNATVRGDFVNQRPVSQKYTLSYSANATLGLSAAQVQAKFQAATALFQAATYFNPTAGSEFVMFAVGGMLFSLSLGTVTNTATIAIVALPDSLESTTAVINWMWQSEKWLVWNDGASLPIFYDGGTARRSLGPTITPLMTTALLMIVPPIATTQVVAVTIQPQYLNGTGASQTYIGPVNIPVLVNNALYLLTNVSFGTGTSGTTGVAGSIFSGLGNDAVAANTTFFSNTKYVGWIASSSVATWPSNAAPPATTITCQPSSAGLLSNNYVGHNYDIKDQYGHTQISGVITNQVNAGNITTLTLSVIADNYTGGNVVYPLTIYIYGGGTVTFGVVNLSVSTWPPVAGGVPFFTLTFTTPTASFSTSDTLQVTLASGHIAQFKWNGSGLIGGTPTYNCYMVNSAALGENIPVLGGSPPGTFANLVINISTQSLTGIFSWTAAVVLSSFTGSGITIIPTNSPPTVGMIVQVANNGGGTDILYIGSVFSTVGTGGSWNAQLENQNDTSQQVPLGTVIYTVPELPAGKMGTYGRGRNWICLTDGKSYVASDAVGGSSGSITENYLDAVLKVSQNYFLAGGGTFVVPGAGTQIQAMKFVASLDASLGQGPLQILTQDNIFSCDAPTDITTWATTTNPIVTESLIGSGGISQDSVDQENNDLIFRTIDGDVRSMLMARLDFNQWGNTPISNEVDRSLANDNPTLLPFDTSIVSNNRRLMACQPAGIPGVTRGIYHQALVALNYDPLSSLQGKQPSVWDGEWAGLNILKLIEGGFSGVKRCFAVCLSNDLTQIELHEILKDGAGINDDGTTQVTWFFESPCLFDHKLDSEFKRLINGEFSLKNIQSNISVQVFYKPDQYPNWVSWYNTTIVYGANDPGFRSRLGLGDPSAKAFDPTNNRPLREAYNFQVKFVITGSCMFTSARFAADLIPQPEFAQPK